MHLKALTADAQERARLETRALEHATAQANGDIEEADKGLASLLSAPQLDRDAHLAALKLPEQDLSEEMSELGPPPTYEAPVAPSGLKRLSRKARFKYEQAALAAQSDFGRELRDYWTRHEQLRRQLLAERPNAEREADRIRRQHAEVGEFRRAVKDQDPGALAELIAVALLSAPTPPGFPDGIEVSFEADTRRVIVDMQVPGLSAVPTDDLHSVDASEGRIRTAERPLPERLRAYRHAIAALAIRAISDALLVDKERLTQTVVFNGYQGERCAISILATRDVADRFDLRAEALERTLERLEARTPPGDRIENDVEPIVTTAAVDTPYRAGPEVHRPGAPVDLSEVDTASLRQLVGDLFQALGTSIPECTRDQDGRVLLEAFGRQGEKVLVDLSHGPGNVGVKAIREHAAALARKEFARAYVVTTRGFTRAALGQAKDSDGLELLDGRTLVEMLHEQLGVQAVLDGSDEAAVPAPVLV